MKQLFIFALLISNSFYLSISKDKMIFGEWRFVKSVSPIENFGDNLYGQKISGFVGEVKLDFKQDYTGTFTHSQNNLVDQFNWLLDGKKLSLNYHGDNLILKSLNGKFKIQTLNKHTMELINVMNKKSIVFER